MSIIPVVLTLLAGMIAIGGLRFAPRSSRPTLLRAGALTTGAGLILLWVLPLWLFADMSGEGALVRFVAALFVAGSVLGLGLQLVARAGGAGAPSHADSLADDFIAHNDLP